MIFHSETNVVGMFLFFTLLSDSNDFKNFLRGSIEELFDWKFFRATTMYQNMLYENLFCMHTLFIVLWLNSLMNMKMHVLIRSAVFVTLGLFSLLASRY